MSNYEIIEINCVKQMEVDFVPLHDIVREFSGYDQTPKEIEFIESLKFIVYLSKKYKIKFLEGPEMKEINKSTNRIVEWLKESWYSNKYDEINYLVWLKKD